MANKYAAKHPDKTILLIDMCPQTDLSHACLGTDPSSGADYVGQLGALKRDALAIGDQKIPKTVSGYLDLATSRAVFPQSCDPRTFLINVSKFNAQLSHNIYLLCGDASIELMARSLEQKRNQHATLSQFGSLAWKSVTCSLKIFIKKIAERKGIKLVVFIDNNSAFSILTEIALAASDKLLIPITDENVHRNGFEYMFALLYGFSQPSNVYYYYRHFSFYFRANEHDVLLPKIHMFLNRSLSDENNNSNGAEKNEKNNANGWEYIFELYKKHPKLFSHRNFPPENPAEFKNEYVIDICHEASTNKIVRESVKLHSPLLNPKWNKTTTNRSFNLTCNLDATKSSSTANLTSTNKTNSLATRVGLADVDALSKHSSQSSLKLTSRVRSSSTSLRNSFRNSFKGLVQSPKLVPKLNQVDNASHFRPNEKQNYLSIPSRIANDEDNNDNNSVSSNAVLFDKILEKIIDSLAN